MVNAADLLLVGVARQFAVQRLGGGEIVAEGFLHHDALPAGAFLVQQAGAMDLLDDFAKLARLGREIKQQIFPQRAAAERSQHFLQLFVGGGIGKVAPAIKQIFGECVPHRVVHRLGARKLVELLAQFVPPRFIRLVAPGKADDAERGAAFACPCTDDKTPG